MKKFLYVFGMVVVLSTSEANITKDSYLKRDYNKDSFQGDFQTRDFSYLLGKLKGFSNALLEMHFTLYKGYVKSVNTLIQALEEMKQGDQDRSLAFGALKRRFGWEYDGMRLHELYFENLGKTEDLPVKSDLYMKIEKDFGSYENWKKDFLSTGLMRGIGWVILYVDPIKGRLFNTWINEHDLGHLAGGTPLLVMDVWEHAYITEYGLDRARYIDMFMYNLNWEVVGERYKSTCLDKTLGHEKKTTLQASR